MPGVSAAEDRRGNYSGWLIGLGIIGGVFVVAAILWLHYHG
jgi:hypothetical protein